jgi:hypothetical protein
MRFQNKNHHINSQKQNPVGAGLLAKAQCQSMHMQADPTPSRASPLPQWRSEFSRQTRTLVDRTLGVQLGRHIGAADQVHVLPCFHQPVMQFT